MTPVEEEIARFKQNILKYAELSDEAKVKVQAHWQKERCGFVPTLTIRASGVQSENRQALLAKIKRLSESMGFNSEPPVRLVLEPDNEWDEYAIRIEIPTIKDAFGDYSGWEHGGYIPKGKCPHCGATLTGPMLESSSCTHCSGELKDSEGNFTNKTTEFNKYLTEKIKEGKVNVALDRILHDPTVTRSSIGLQIAIKIDE